MNKNENVVIAIFAGQAEADNAVERLQKWDKDVKDIKLGAIGQVKNAGGAAKTSLVSGGFFKRSFPMSDEGVTALVAEMSDGQVAVAVGSDDYEVAMVKRHLESAGGRIISAYYERTAEEIADEQKAADAAAQQQAYDKTVDRSLDVGAINKSGFN